VSVKAATAWIVGVIGGEGQLGRWAAELFREAGCCVRISDLDTEISPTDLVREVDIVIVSVPIGVTEAVVQEISPLLRADQLVVDLTSVKTPFVPLMEMSKAEVLSLHPMFAPSLTVANGQTCIVCPVRRGEKASWFERIVRTAGLHIVEMSPDVHDKTMAVVQGMTHFQAIVAGHCMAALGFEPTESLAFASPVYKARLAMIGRILAQSPKLYAEIQIFNPYVKEVLKQLQSSSEALAQLVEAKDVDGFVREFSRVRDALGAFSAESLSGMAQGFEGRIGS
jgi:prephenate dehydrogenase